MNHSVFYQGSFRGSFLHLSDPHQVWCGPKHQGLLRVSLLTNQDPYIPDCKLYIYIIVSVTIYFSNLFFCGCRRTPLQCAAYGGFVNCMSVLIEHKADVNARDRDVSFSEIRISMH